MEELIKSQMLLDELAIAIAEERDEDALKYYEEYKEIYEKITCKKFPKTFEQLKKSREQKTSEEELEIEL